MSYQKLGEEITERLGSIDRHEQYIENWKGKDFDSERHNKIRVQKLKCQVREKVKELLLLLKN